MSYALEEAIRTSDRMELKKFWYGLNDLGRNASDIFLNFVANSKYMEEIGLLSAKTYKSGIMKFLSYWTEVQRKMKRALANSYEQPEINLTVSEVYSLNVKPIAEILGIEITEKELEKEQFSPLGKVAHLHIARRNYDHHRWS